REQAGSGHQRPLEIMVPSIGLFFRVTGQLPPYSRDPHMQFGIFFELSVLRPFSPEAERRVFEDALEQIRVADSLGFATAWAVEHHFLEEYSHCSSPELFLTAAARETRDI